MDKNTITGLILIALIIFAYTLFTRPSKEQLAEQQRHRDSILLVENQKKEFALLPDTLSETTDLLTDSSKESFFATNNKEDTTHTDAVLAAADTALIADLPKQELITLENDKLKLRLNTQGGSIHSVQIKGETNYKNDSLLIFEDQEARFNLDLFNRNSIRLSTQNQLFRPIPIDDGKTIVMRLENTPQQYIDFIYSLPESGYLVNFDIRVVGMKNGLHPESLANFKLSLEQKIRQQEKGRQFENRHARLFYKYTGQDVKKLSESKKEQKELTEPVKWVAFKDQFFSSIIISKNSFSNVIVSTEALTHTDYIKQYKSELWIPVAHEMQKDELSAGFNYYFGPNHFYTLRGYDKQLSGNEANLDLEELVDLGHKWLSWINKYFTLPLFNYFLSLNLSMGLIIFIMTLIIKLIILPLTYKSFKSSAKMRVLRPQIQELEKKYPGQDQEMMMKRQQATMELYNRAGANPMSGCFPMLLQMPILFAFFFFFPTAIELRHQNFLWANDLSTYDAILEWNFNIPFISGFMGNHISLFCLLMTIVNVIYTKYNMSMTDTGQSQMAVMKWMPVFMSVFMFFFLNSYPSGLNYYYFLSTLITIILTFGFKRFLDEDKLLAQLEANKAKPKKKSGFMARLEEAQKIREKQARERARENAKKNYRR